MKRLTFFVILSCALGLLVAPAVSFADLTDDNSSVSKSEWVHNGDAAQDDATDLHFRFEVPDYEKETYWFESYSWNVDGNVNVASSTVTEDTNDGGEVWAVDVDVVFTTAVPHCEEVTINVDVKLNAANTINIVDVYFTYETSSDQQAVPDTGFEFDVVTQYPQSQTTHVANYTFHNRDDTLTVYVGLLTFWASVVWCDAGDVTCVQSVGVQVGADVGRYEIPPESSRTWEVSGIDNRYRYIFVLATMDYDIATFDPTFEEHAFMDGHEETLEAVPSVSEWGLILLGLLLISAGAVVIVLRRYKTATA